MEQLSPESSPSVRQHKFYPTVTNNRPKTFESDEDAASAVVCHNQITCDHESSLRGREARFAGKPVLRSALVALVAILGTDLADVQLARGQDHVFAI